MQTWGTISRKRHFAVRCSESTAGARRTRITPIWIRIIRRVARAVVATLVAARRRGFVYMPMTKYIMPITLYGLKDALQWGISSNKDVDIYTDTREYHPNSNIKVYLQVEPNAIYPCYDYLRENSHLYDTILCYMPEKVGSPNAVKKIDAGTWITEELYTSIDMDAKSYSISAMTGWKSDTVGHRLRHQLYFNQTSLRQFPITFFRSSVHPQLPEITNNPFIPSDSGTVTRVDGKIALFNTFQFSIVIENSKENNYFSEKLMDCILTKTIPIYYGCPNISEYFDTTGWILIDDGDIVKYMQELNDTYYARYASTVKENYERALKFADRRGLYASMTAPYI